MTRKPLLVLVAVALIGASAWGFSRYRSTDKKPEIVTAAITRGDVVDAAGRLLRVLPGAEGGRARSHRSAQVRVVKSRKAS